MGTELANKVGLGTQVSQALGQATNRSVILRILTPHPEIRTIPFWLEKYMTGQIKGQARSAAGLLEDAVSEESFLVFMDPANNRIQIKDPKDAAQFTVEVAIEAGTALVVASRAETCYTAWLKGMPVWTEGEAPVRDINIIDEILEVYYKLMSEAGHDMANLFQGAIV